MSRDGVTNGDGVMAGAERDEAANRAIRGVASTPSPEHVIPAEVVAFLYQHVDLMRAEFFGSELPEVVLSFDVTDRRTLGHYVTRRNSLGVRWALNLNPIHLARPVYEVLATLLHELAHAWQHRCGTPSKPPFHNKEFRERCEAFGIPTDEGGHYLGVRHGTPFEAYCRHHGVGFPAPPGSGTLTDGDHPAPTPLLPEPPARPRGSRMRKWRCPCGVNVRVAIRSFDATCNRCGGRFELAG
jgi:predicted SprT family Zn-dependent metalloprotease